MKFLLALVRTNLKASVALRGAFLLRAVMMLFNNLVFFAMWWIFFDRYEEVRGFVLADMAALYGICAGAFGLAIVFGSGVRDISRYITEGDLDAFLSQPKSPLALSIASHSDASGWGDIVTAAILFGLSGYVTPASLPFCVIGTLAGAIVFVSMGVVLHSLTFWMGNTGAFSRQMWEFMISFSIYPKTIFGGWAKVLLFTAIPAGFISHLPVDLVRRFDWLTLAAVLGGALLYALLARLIFAAGLRRYESGNRFGVRA